MTIKHFICASIIFAISTSMHHHTCPWTLGGPPQKPVGWSVPPDQIDDCDTCAQCTSTNDPHINTFDDVFYDQHTADCFQYVVECRWAAAPVPFEICGCHYKTNGGTTGPANIGDVTISFFDGVGATTHNIVIDYTAAGVNALETIVAAPLAQATYAFGPHQFTYTRIGSKHIFRILGSGSSFRGYISYQPGFLDVWLDDYFETNTCGLCGVFDDNPYLDFVGSDGVLYIPPRPLPMIPWPITPADETQINLFAETYLCDGDQGGCYEEAAVCCKVEWGRLEGEKPWRNQIVAKDEFKGQWMRGCIADVCALAENMLSTQCEKEKEFMIHAQAAYENTAQNTYGIVAGVRAAPDAAAAEPADADPEATPSP